MRNATIPGPGDAGLGTSWDVDRNFPHDSDGPTLPPVQSKLVVEAFNLTKEIHEIQAEMKDIAGEVGQLNT